MYICSGSVAAPHSYHGHDTYESRILCSNTLLVVANHEVGPRPRDQPLNVNLGAFSLFVFCPEENKPAGIQERVSPFSYIVIFQTNLIVILSH